jgi:hypothetical protein
MTKRVPNHCPSCQHEMVISQLTCPHCGTQVEGSFELDVFSRLTPEQRSFCLLFIRCRGSLKDVGNELGISYPTARNRLDDLIIAMGFARQPLPDMRMQVLEALSQGKISAQQALEKLKGAEEE